MLRLETYFFGLKICIKNIDVYFHRLFVENSRNKRDENTYTLALFVEWYSTWAVNAMVKSPSNHHAQWDLNNEI